MPDSGKSFGQHVEQPPTDEFVRMQGHHGGPVGGGAGPAQADVAMPVVAEQSLGTEGAALDVAGEVAQGGLAAADGLELNVPGFRRAQNVALAGGELLVDLGVMVPQRAVETAAESLGKWLVVDEKSVFLRVDELAGIGPEGNGGDDDVDVGVVLDLASPSMKDASESAPGSLVFGGNDITQGSCAFAQDEVVDDCRVS